MCIPSYYGERYLPEALRSVAEQTWRDWELILVEDGSRDGTESIVRAFKTQQEQPVTYLRNERNLGLHLRHGTAPPAAARGEFIAMLDADDRWVRDHLEGAARQLFSRTGADVVFSGGEQARRTLG